MEILEKMEYITLNNGVKMPMAGLGTFLLSPDEAQESVYAALKEGYQLIDTANAYVNEEESRRGYSGVRYSQRGDLPDHQSMGGTLQLSLR